MRLILKVMTGLLAAILLISGSVIMLGGMEGLAEIVGAGSLGNVTEAARYPLVDNVMRFLGAVMFTLGLDLSFAFSTYKTRLYFFASCCWSLFWAVLRACLGGRNQALF
jgi:hypothetical protein